MKVGRKPSKRTKCLICIRCPVTRITNFAQLWPESVVGFSSPESLLGTLLPPYHRFIRAQKHNWQALMKVVRHCWSSGNKYLHVALRTSTYLHFNIIDLSNLTTYHWTRRRPVCRNHNENRRMVSTIVIG
jgi:hypothetical protein